MKAQHALGLSLSWSRVVTVFFIDVAVLVLASHWPGDSQQAIYAWWSGVGVAALLTVAALGTYHRIPFTTALAARVHDRFDDPETLLAEEHTRAIDHRRRYGRCSVGIREYRNQLVTVIAVEERAVSPAGRHHRGASTAVGLPVQLVAGALRQFDVRLAGIDIVSVESHGADSADASEDTVASDPEATNPPVSSDRRSTWLVLRMDPQDNAGAAASRDSVAATLAAATERLAHDLDGREITARVLTCEEFAGVDTAVLAGLQPRRQQSSTQYVTCYWVSPPDITSENLDRLWLADIDATVVTVRLRPRHHGTEVSVLVRYHSGVRLHKQLRAELNRFIGRRLTAVRGSLPVPTRSRALVVPSRQLADQEDLAISLDSGQQPADRAGASA